MEGLFENLSNAAHTFLGHNRHHRVGVSNASVVESEGRVWVEVGGCSGGSKEDGGGLKLRVTHLHPDNPAIASAILQYRSSLLSGQPGVEEGLDKVSLSSQEDFWFNHWQGPAICPTAAPTSQVVTQQPQQQRTASIRRSSRRCTTCHKKVSIIIGPERDEPDEDILESPVLAHLPSLRRSKLKIGASPPTISPPDPALLPPPPTLVTPDQDRWRGEDTLLLSHLSASDEQLSRSAQRVLELEQRITASMFGDVLDGAGPTTNGVGATASTSEHQVTPDATPAEEVSTPWRSKSCPCSPKAAARSRDLRPQLSPTNSPKWVSSSKFSLSGSLWALHRQASNSLRGDLFKFDSSNSKMDAIANISKTSSLQSSIKLKKMKSHCSIDEEENSSILSEEESCGEASVHNSITKKPVRESHSLPALKLSRMSLMYRGGIITKEEDSSDLVPEEGSSSDSTPEVAGACALTETEEVVAGPEALGGYYSSQLPDLIPKSRVSPVPAHGNSNVELNQSQRKKPPVPVAAVSPFHFNAKGGVINLGFDGLGESSDFTDAGDSNAAEMDDNNTNVREEGLYDLAPKIHGMSMGHLRSSKSDVEGFDVSPRNSNVEENVDTILNGINFPGSLRLNHSVYSSDNDVSSPTSNAQSTFSTAPSTAQCSPSALRIRVMDGIPNTPNTRQMHKPKIDFKQSNNCSAELQQDKLLGQEYKLELSQPVTGQPNSLLVGQQDTLAGNHAEVFGRPSKPAPGSNKPETGCLRRGSGAVPPAAAEQADVEEESSSNLSEARALVYWWQELPAGDVEAREDYCLRQGDCGKKQRPLLLFVHSVGGSGDDWHQQLWYFVSQGYEVVAPDLLGHGYSSAPDRGACYRFPRLLDHLRLLYDLFVPRGRKCVLVGHGYGCALVAALSRCRPSSVPMMVLAACGGPSPLVPPSAAAPSTWGATFDPYFGVRDTTCCGSAAEDVRECCDVLCGGGGELGAVEAAKMVMTTTCWLACCLPCVCAKREAVYQPRGKQLCSGALHSPGTSSTPAYVLRHMVRGQRWPEGDVAFHRRITVPVLLLHGLRDTTTPLVHMCEMEKTIPRAFLEVLGSCGHQLMTDNPADVNAALHRFLTRWERLT